MHEAAARTPRAPTWHLRPLRITAHPLRIPTRAVFGRLGGVILGVSGGSGRVGGVLGASIPRLFAFLAFFLQFFHAFAFRAGAALNADAP